MSFEVEGKIINKLNAQSGTSQRGEWSKQEFIIEYQDGSYTSQLCLNVWGADKVKDLGNYQVGDRVKISFSAGSREYNGRWYTDLRAWRIESVGSAAAAQGGYTPDYAPTQAQGNGPEYAPTPTEAASTGHGYTAPDTGAASEEDDLPF